jgi:hypothetical protein
VTTCHMRGGHGAYLSVNKNDQLVRLNIGVTPYDVYFSDWVVITGDLLYLWMRADGGVNYLRVPLDFRMLESIRESAVWGESSMYRGVVGEPTLLAIYLGFVFLDRNVSVAAIRRELCLSETTMNWLISVWQCAGGVIDPDRLLRLVRLMRFEDEGQD